MRSLTPFFLLFLLASCFRGRLLVQSDIVSAEDLASSHVLTPDYKRLCPPFGQRLIVLWRLKKQDLALRDPHLLITYRTRDLEEETIRVPLCAFKGTYVANLVGCDYLEKGGIETYKVEIYAGGVLLETWKHLLWYDLIILQDKP